MGFVSLSFEPKVLELLVARKIPQMMVGVTVIHSKLW